MNYRDIDKLKPGVRLRIKRGYYAAGETVEFVGFPVCGNRELIEVKFGNANELWTINKVMLVKDCEPIRSTVSCSYCGEPKQPGTYCSGCDECTYGLDGHVAECCSGWGRYCCRCGAVFARGQLP